MNALNALNGKFSPKLTLAKEAINIEQNVLKEAVGSQDQISAAFGGLNRIDFHEDDTFSVRPIILGLKESLFWMRTFFSSLLASRGLRRLSPRKRSRILIKGKGTLADEGYGVAGIEILGQRSCPLSEFGELLHQAWMYKRELAQGVTNSKIDAVYDAALAACGRWQASWCWWRWIHPVLR